MHNSGLPLGSYLDWKTNIHPILCMYIAVGFVSSIAKRFVLESTRNISLMLSHLNYVLVKLGARCAFDHVDTSKLGLVS